jgi:hypothetical protein
VRPKYSAPRTNAKIKAKQRENKMNTNLTTYETEVLAELKESSAGNGHDFGFIEDVKNLRRARGVISSLSQKGWIEVHDAITTDSGRWTQFTFSEEAIAHLGLFDESGDDDVALLAALQASIAEDTAVVAGPTGGPTFATFKDAEKAVQRYVIENGIDAGKLVDSASLSRGVLLVRFQRAKYTVKATGEIEAYETPTNDDAGPTAALAARTVSTIAVLQVSKFRSRVIRSTHMVGADTPVSVFEFASEPLAHSDALKHARYLINGPQGIVRTEVAQ